MATDCPRSLCNLLRYRQNYWLQLYTEHYQLYLNTSVIIHSSVKIDKFFMFATIIIIIIIIKHL